MSDSAFEVAATQTSSAITTAPKATGPQSTITPGKLPQLVEYSLNSVDSPPRVRLEKFVCDRFSNCYGAAIVEFFPLFLARTDNDRISSVVGLRPGTDRPLFLEQYLHSTLEQAIAGQMGTAVARDQIMEIGNLASSHKSGNQLMFVMLTAILAKAGYSWVVFTATAQVRSLLKRLDFHPVTLCEADPTRLVNKHQVWGSYYQSQPLVQAGNVMDGLDILQANKHTRSLLTSHESDIEALANQLCLLKQQYRSAD